MSASKSDPVSQQQSVAQTIADSYNTTVNRVANISNAGNVSIAVPTGEDGSALATKILPFGVIFFAIGAVFYIFVKKGAG